MTWKEWAAYRTHMAVSLLTGPLRFLIMAWLWTATLAEKGRVLDHGREEWVAYSGLAVLIGYVLFDFADWNLHMLVRTGRFANYLLLPFPHLFLAFAQKLGHRSLALLIEAVPVWALISWWLGHPLLPNNPLPFMLSVIQGFVLTYLINYAVGLLGFWMTRTEGLRRCLVLLRETLGGAYLPLAFFPLAWQPVLFLLPYAWALYIPISIGLAPATGSIAIAGQEFTPWQALAGQSLVMAVWGVGLFGLQSLAMRRFLAAGG